VDTYRSSHKLYILYFPLFEILTVNGADSAQVTSFKRCFVICRCMPVLFYVRQTRLTQILGNSGRSLTRGTLLQVLNSPSVPFNTHANSTVSFPYCGKELSTPHFYPTGWWSGNSLHLHSGDACFKFRPDHPTV